MLITVPYHQFEIRFTKLLNFSSMVQVAIGPFIPMALDVQIEKENTSNCRYVLIFTGYNIFISVDRVLIRYDGDIKNLRENNSIIESPFFSLFNKIKALPGFGSVRNCLCDSIIICHTDKEQSEIVNEFINKFLVKENTEKIVSKPSDICITLNKNIDNKLLSVQYGPYLGVDDLKNRCGLPQNSEILSHLGKLGEMAEVKIFEILKDTSFAKYKDYLKLTLEYQKALWKQ
jgi:hypothetical protein